MVNVYSIAVTVLT